MPLPNIASQVQSVLCAAVIGVATLSFAAPSSASSLLEVYGNFSGTGTLKADITGISWRASNLEWTVGTYAHSGGQLPSGGVIPGGGIDSMLNVSQTGVVLATSDNLSGTNLDGEIHTSNVTGRPGSAVLPPQPWVSSFTVGVAPVSAGSLGNGSFSLVSYLPNDSLQYLDNVVVPASATLSGIYATGSRISTSAGHAIALSDRLKLSNDSYLYIADGNLTAKNLTMSGSTIAVTGSGMINVENFEFGEGQGDRGRITITGTGGIEAKYAYLGSLYPDAAVTVEQQSGTFVTQSLTLDRSGSTGTTSHYYLYGGMLKTNSLWIDDGVLHLAGGTLDVASIDTLAAGTLGSKIVWDSGKIAVSTAANAPLSTNGFFGSVLTLMPGRSLSLNAPGLTSFVNLTGGKLSLRELANNGLAMNWQSGELEITGAVGTSIGVGRALGDQIVLRQNMTLRVSSGLTTEMFTRLVLNDGSRAIAGSLTNNGELALQSTGASLDVVGTLTNNGVIRGSGRISGTLNNQSAGRVEIDSSDSLRLVGNLSNNGQIRLTGGELLINGFNLVNNSGGKVTGRGTIGAGQVDNRGTITLSAGLSDIDTPLLTNRNNAKLIVTGAGGATFYGNIVNDTGSEFRISADSRATFLGSVTNLAAFTGSGAKVFDGVATGAGLMTGGSTAVEAGGSLAVAGIRETALTLRGDATIVSNSAVSRVNTLTLDGGNLDLRNNTMVIDYAAASPIASMRTAVLSGELFSSLLQPRAAIALAEARDLNRASVGDVALDSTALVLTLALKGDANIDGAVSFDDLLRLAQNYGNASRNWAQGDFTGDGIVGFEDLLGLAQNYNGTLQADGNLVVSQSGDQSFASGFELAVSLAPEPTSLLTVLGVVMLTRSRRW